MKPRVLILLVIIIAVSFILYKYPKCRFLTCVNFPDQNSYSLKEVYYQDQNTFRGIYGHGSDLLRVDIRKIPLQTEAEEIIQERLAQISNLYAPSRSPYPGILSSMIDCDQSLKPEIKQFQDAQKTIYYYRAYLNSQLVAGACSRDQAVHQETVALFYCAGNKYLFQLEFIGDFDEKLIGAFNCRSR